MNKNQVLNIIFLLAIIAISFFLYSSRFYPLLNSDDALNILMTHYYDLPNDFYCWGQDRGGTFIPLISQFFHKTLGFSAVTSVSFSNYLILLIGYFGFSSLFKNKTTKLLFAFLWFFPPIIFIGLMRFPIGVQYSLIGISIYFINRVDFINKKGVVNHLLLIFSILPLSISIWVSDLAIVTITILVIVLSSYYFLIEKRKRINKYILLYGAGGIFGTYLFITYAKSFATAVTKNYATFNDWTTFKEGLSILKSEFVEVFSFRSADVLFSIYAWCVLALCVFLAGSYANKKSLKILKSEKWISFFIIDFFAIFSVILLSKWVYLNGMGRWYFVTSYISLSILILLLFDNLQISEIKRKVVTSFLFLTIIVGSLSTIYSLKFISPKRLRSEISVRSEFLSLGEIGLIGEFWNSYISACPDPSKIKATAHDKSDVKNQKLVDGVFAQPNLYVIRDMWMEEFPDTMIQFGYMLKKKGDPFMLGGCYVNKYDKIKRNQILNFDEFEHRASDSKTEGEFLISKDSIDLKNSYAVWGPFIPLGIGDYLVKIKLSAKNTEQDKPIASFQVTSNYGKRVFIEKELRTIDVKSENSLFELNFSSKERLTNLEIRILNYGTADLIIKEIKLIEK